MQGFQRSQRNAETYLTQAGFDSTVQAAHVATTGIRNFKLSVDIELQSCQLSESPAANRKKVSTNIQ